MKITQHMIEQAAVIANAKVGDELEESIGGERFKSCLDDGGAIIGPYDFTYRIKPQPRTIWVNEYPNGGYAVHESIAAAKDITNSDATRIAVEYREVVPDGT